MNPFDDPAREGYREQEMADYDALQPVKTLALESFGGTNPTAYLKGGVPSDPWGKPYQYKAPGAGAELQVISLGADGAVGGEGENADLG